MLCTAQYSGDGTVQSIVENKNHIAEGLDIHWHNCNKAKTKMWLRSNGISVINTIVEYTISTSNCRFQQTVGLFRPNAHQMNSIEKPSSRVGVFLFFFLLLSFSCHQNSTLKSSINTTQMGQAKNLTPNNNSVSFYKPEKICAVQKW